MLETRFEKETEHKVVDIEFLWDIAHSDPQDVLEIVEIVQQNPKENIVKLKKALSENNYHVVKQIAHSGAGASANCGIVLFSRMWRELELLASQNKSIEELNEKAECSFIEFSKVERELEKIIINIKGTPH